MRSRVDSHSLSEQPEVKTAEIPVTWEINDGDEVALTRLHGAIYTIGFLADRAVIGSNPHIGGDHAKGCLLLRVFKGAHVNPNAPGAALAQATFFKGWQKIVESYPQCRPLYMNLTATHHMLADALTVLGFPELEEVVLPCRDCGCVFRARRRAGTYRRTCGTCRRPLGLALLRHRNPRGGMLQGVYGYPRRRSDSPLSTAAVVDSIACAHDGCGARFLTTRSDVNYCTEHREPKHRTARSRSSGEPSPRVASTSPGGPPRIPTA